MPKSPPRAAIYVLNVAPDTVGANVGQFTPISFDLVTTTAEVSEGSFSTTILVAYFQQTNVWECVYDGAAFTPNYAQGSSLTPTSDETDSDVAYGFTWTLNKAGGWISSPTFYIQGITSTGAEFFFPIPLPSGYESPSSGGGFGGSTPTLSNVSPSPEEGPLDRYASVSFNVETEDDDYIAIAVILVYFADSPTVEVAYDGANFAPLYALGSSLTTVFADDYADTTFEFVVARAGGWPSSPRFVVHAFDQEGDESS